MDECRLSNQGVSFQVRLTPKGGCDRVAGWAPGPEGSLHLKARVAAAPENGKANAALIALLADVLGVPKSSVRIAAGTAGRLKRIEIHGDGAALAARLKALGKAA